MLQLIFWGFIALILLGIGLAFLGFIIRLVQGVFRGGASLLSFLAGGWTLALRFWKISAAFLAVFYFFPLGSFHIVTVIAYIYVLSRALQKDSEQNIAAQMETILSEKGFITCAEIATITPRDSEHLAAWRKRFKIELEATFVIQTMMNQGLVEQAALWDEDDVFFYDKSKIPTQKIKMQTEYFLQDRLEKRLVWHIEESIPLGTITAFQQLERLYQAAVVKDYLTVNTAAKRLSNIIVTDEITHKKYHFFVALNGLNARIERMFAFPLLTPEDWEAHFGKISEYEKSAIMFAYESQLQIPLFEALPSQETKIWILLSLQEQASRLLQERCLTQNSLTTILGRPCNPAHIPAIMKFFENHCTGFKFIGTTDSVGNAVWVNQNFAHELLCSGCGKLFDKLIPYGKKNLCSSCLSALHAQEEADEKAGKSVVRPIAAPPPGVVIKVGK